MNISYKSTINIFLIFAIIYFIVYQSVFSQNTSNSINKIDSICTSNNVFRFQLTRFEPSTSNPLDENPIGDVSLPPLINLVGLKSSGIFQELRLLACYDLNYNLIRIEGYEQRENCGIQYKWYFENSVLVAINQTRHGFVNASDDLKNTIIKEVLLNKNNNWSGSRELYKEGTLQSSEQLSSYDQSLVNIHSRKLPAFMSSKIYKFIENNMQYYSDADATNFDFKLKTSKYYYNCPSSDFLVKNLIYYDIKEAYYSTTSRVLLTGSKLKKPQFFTFRGLASYQESIQKASPNGAIKIADASWCLEWIDVNFDGHDDIKIYSRQIDCYYVYNPELKLFEFNPLINGNQIIGMGFNVNEKKVEWLNNIAEEQQEIEIPKIFFKWDNGYLRKFIE
jgi:hypothetical protein